MTKTKHEAQIVLLGGPRNGETDAIASHAEASFETDEGGSYWRTDRQEGDFRVYAYEPPPGGTPDPVRVTEGVAIESKLEHDLAQYEAEKKARDTEPEHRTPHTSATRKGAHGK